MGKIGKANQKILLTAYRRVRKFIRRPWFYDKKFLVILSVVSSLFLWSVLSVNASPEEVRTVPGVHITIDQEGIEENFGVRFVEVISPESLKDLEFDIKVRGRRYLISQLTGDDFTAVATANKSVSKPGSYDFTVSVSCNNPLLDLTVSNNGQQMYVKFDRYVTKEFAVSGVEGVGATVAADSALSMGTPYSNVAKVRIEGPENEVAKIASVIIRADVNKELYDGESFDGTEVFRNEHGDELTLGQNMTITRYTAEEKVAENVKVTIPIKTSKKFKVNVAFPNAPDSFDKTKLPLSVSPGSVTLVGTPDAIQNFSDSYGSVYLAGEIDLTRLSNKVNSFTFPVSLSTGLEMSDSVENIKVKVNLSEYSVEKMTLTSAQSKFDYINYVGSREVKVKTKSIGNVQIIGPAHVLSQIKPSDITVYADMTGFETVIGPCTVNAVVSIANHSNCWVIGTYTVDAVIS
ncbi:MAG: hypothetical protein IIU00_07040 [Clostridia bacterium]|nr:hypothetical protein [Clostridia bacterium]